MPAERQISVDRNLGAIPNDKASLLNTGKYYDAVYRCLYIEGRSEFMTHLMTNDELLARNHINPDFHRKTRRALLKKSKEEEMDVLTDSMSAVVFMTTVWGFIIWPIFSDNIIVRVVYFAYIFFIYLMTFFLYRKKYRDKYKKRYVAKEQ